MKKNQKTKKKRRPLRHPQVAASRKSIWLNVLPDDIWLRVKQGITIYEALKKTPLDLDSECNGLGTCGKCKVRVVTPIGPPDPQEMKLLSSEERNQGIRLACRTRIQKSLVVFSDTDRDPTDVFQILKHGSLQDYEIDPLLEIMPLSVNPPDARHTAPDFQRLRSALGPQYRDLEITHNCLAALYTDLRRTEFTGEALVHDGCMLAWSPAGSPKGRFGLIFDIGTTTLVGKLIDLQKGVEMGVISRLNAQSRFGSDIITRIQYVRQSKHGLKRLRRLLINDLNAIMRRLSRACDIAPENIYIAVAAGNTTMQHFLLGLDPSGIAEAPFAPVITEGVTFPAVQIGLEINPGALLCVMPAKTGYIGGDLISFILSSGVTAQTDKIVLGMDLGTNGEIFLSHGDRLLSCSAAAGPALEGARISHGMIAKSGAIESVQAMGAQLHYNIVGNVKPKGLCGSGLVDLVAVLLHHGVIDPQGLMGPDRIDANAAVLRSRLIPRSGKQIHDFLVASAQESFDGRTILLRQKDIRELQLAKGAVAGAVEILMQRMNITPGDIDRIHLAGALGNYVHPLSAMRIGLIPQIDPAKVVAVGNAASTGATMALLSKAKWRLAGTIADQMEQVELSLDPDFYDAFVAGMDFPENNTW